MTDSCEEAGQIDADRAKEEIERCAGTQYDPRVVAEFLAIQNGELNQARKEAETTVARGSHALPI